ncbi:MAG: 16S rRNA (uracil(1498)-N(3))-methyltransferase [Candidatus Peribacteria bacterium]|jgi:16S rRNA (uracil1498-N3)-methyltransferase|nr:16S rRNA (uracil(1498)-N(3))-methyltransferase [Candidatus Peribacteria bacterium]
MHQLFIIPTLQKKGNQLFLPHIPDLLVQLRKVLRAKIGEHIFVQSLPSGHHGIIRYELKITHRTDEDLEGEIMNEQPLVEGIRSPITLLIAMPNKREKAELVVQKLSEIGIDEILFRPAERSIITTRNPKKAERLHKIAKEATEQSRGIRTPTIAWCEEVKKCCEGKELIVFDQTSEEESKEYFFRWKEHLSDKEMKAKCAIIGPEG